MCRVKRHHLNTTLPPGSMRDKVVFFPAGEVGGRVLLLNDNFGTSTLAFFLIFSSCSSSSTDSVTVPSTSSSFISWLVSPLSLSSPILLFSSLVSLLFSCTPRIGDKDAVRLLATALLLRIFMLIVLGPLSITVFCFESTGLTTLGFVSADGGEGGELGNLVFILGDVCRCALGSKKEDRNPIVGGEGEVVREVVRAVGEVGRDVGKRVRRIGEVGLDIRVLMLVFVFVFGPTCWGRGEESRVFGPNDAGFVTGLAGRAEGILAA